MTQKVITVILGLIIIGGLAWYLNRNYLQSSNKPGETQSFSHSPGANSSKKTSGNLVYTIFSNDKEIWMANSSLEKKKLFTDADETEKIIKLSNLATLSREVLAVTSTDENATSGKLVAINLDNAKKETLQSSFAVSSALSVSADGKDICYIKFSNVEENYGYTLYSQKRTGFNIRELARSDKEIRLPAWDKTGLKIAFIKISGVNSELMVSDKENSKTSTIANFDSQVVDWLSWGESDKIILSLRKIGQNSSSEIISIDPETKKDQKLITTDSIVNFVYLSRDLWLSYIAQNTDKIDEQIVGQIYFQNLETDEKIPLQKGNQILGWLS